MDNEIHYFVYYGMHYTYVNLDFNPSIYCTSVLELNSCSKNYVGFNFILFYNGNQRKFKSLKTVPRKYCKICRMLKKELVLREL